MCVEAQKKQNTGQQGANFLSLYSRFQIERQNVIVSFARFVRDMIKQLPYSSTMTPSIRYRSSQLNVLIE
jgi:hypothetical protein